MSGVDERVETAREIVASALAQLRDASEGWPLPNRYSNAFLAGDVALSALAAAVAGLEQRADDAEKALQDTLAHMEFAYYPNPTNVAADELSDPFDAMTNARSVLAAAVVSAEPTEETT